MTNEEAQAIIVSKYQGSTVNTVLANGDVLINVGGGKTLSKIRASEVADMAQRQRHLAEQPKQMNLKEEIGEFAYNALKGKPIDVGTQEPQDESHLLPSERTPKQQPQKQKRQHPSQVDARNYGLGSQHKSY